MEIATFSAEGAAHKRLQQCIETVMAKVEHLLSAEQKATDNKSPDDGIAPDHRPTSVLARVVAHLSRVLEAAFTALEGLNKQAFLIELRQMLGRRTPPTFWRLRTHLRTVASGQVVGCD